LFRTSRPGALDTSLVSTDSINNPRTMNAVYHLGARLEQAKRWYNSEEYRGPKALRCKTAQSKMILVEGA